jgi:hypothetical protein
MKNRAVRFGAASDVNATAVRTIWLGVALLAREGAR